MQNVVMLNVFMLNVVMLNDITLSVVASQNMSMGLSPLQAFSA
jgi:hypothetical protein